MTSFTALTGNHNQSLYIPFLSFVLEAAVPTQQNTSSTKFQENNLIFV
jgi:hypothetical protein